MVHNKNQDETHPETKYSSIYPKIISAEDGQDRLQDTSQQCVNSNSFKVLEAHQGSVLYTIDDRKEQQHRSYPYW